jgi:hypothetical protein
MGLPHSELFGVMSGLVALQGLALLVLLKLIVPEPDKTGARVAYASQARR